MIFHYRFRDESNIVRKGRVTADGQDIAIRRLEMMSVKPMAIWQDGQTEPPWESNEHVGVEATPPDSFFKEQEAIFNKQEEINRQLPPSSFKPILSDGVDQQMPSVESAIRPPKRVEMADIMPSKEQVYSACPKRGQSLFFGEYNDLKNLIDSHLSDGGKVIHLAMQPDVKGKLQIAVVIEHDKGRKP